MLSFFSQGCAIGTGFCAASHLDMVVEQLEHVIKEDMVRKGKSLFGLVKVSATMLICSSVCVSVCACAYMHVCVY